MEAIVLFAICSLVIGALAVAFHIMTASPSRRRTPRGPGRWPRGSTDGPLDRAEAPEQLLPTTFNGTPLLELADRWPVRSKKRLLTGAEARLFNILERVLRHPTNPSAPPQLRIMCSVRLIDVIEPVPHLRGKDRLSAVNRLNRKHVDFVLITVTDFKPVLGIELDDWTHRFKSSQKRDAQKDEAFVAADLPLLRIENRVDYDAKEHATSIKHHLRTQDLRAMQEHVRAYQRPEATPARSSPPVPIRPSSPASGDYRARS